MMFLQRDEKPSAHRTALLVFIVVAEAVGAAASIVTRPNIANWYYALAKPSFNPPDWVFGPVWVTLYLLMAVAAWRVWRVRGLHNTPLALYVIQLALNCAWSFIFFGTHKLGLALSEIVLLLIFVVATAVAFFRTDRLAGVMLLPYIAWATFAALLNYDIWVLNGTTF